MKLFVDAGNSRVKWQLRDADRILCSGAGEPESDALFQGITPADWQRLVSVSVCTVGSEDARCQLQGRIVQATRAPVRFYWTQPRFGDLVCAYSDPSAMGADRWYAMVAAWSLVRGACLVVDAGSAITVDWIGNGGAHEGGYILPGRKLMLSSLSQNTARVLFEQTENRQSEAPGRSTAECVFHGVNWLIRALALQLGKEASVPIVVTGGDGFAVKGALVNDTAVSVKVHHCPDLVLDGLALAEASVCAG